VFAKSLEAFRIVGDKFDRQKFDEQVVQSIESFLPYRDEFISVISAIVRYSSVNDDTPLRRFFEKLIPYMFRPKSLMQYNDWYWDNFRFVIQEMFLYVSGLLLKRERFDLMVQLMSQGYYVGDASGDPYEPMQKFSIIRQPMVSLRYRNERLKLNRLSICADMLEQRSHTSGLRLDELMQADFVLFFVDAITSLKENRRARWWPETLVYYRENAPPFEIFARAESVRYFQKICPPIAVESKAELGELFKRFGVQNSPLLLPHWDVFHSISLEGAMNFEKLASKP
jgi:hypothetical protein